MRINGHLNSRIALESLSVKLNRALNITQVSSYTKYNLSIKTIIISIE